MSVLHLGVNVDHVATLRQQRGTPYPSPLEAGLVSARAGARNITAHLREDRRHIQEADIRALRRELPIPLNLEMAHAPDIIRLALELRPAEVCLVPERRAELTTEGGLDAAGMRKILAPTLTEMRAGGIRVSLFIEADERQIRAAAELGAPCIELHTGTYCDAPPADARRELGRLKAGAVLAHELGLQVNAGHGINLQNLAGILTLPHLDTLNIGHSLVGRAVFIGLDAAVREMLAAMKPYGG